MDEGLLSELKKIVTSENRGSSINRSPSPIKSRIGRYSRRDVSPETRLSRSQIEGEMRTVQDKILENTRSIISTEIQTVQNRLDSYMRQVIENVKELKEKQAQDCEEIIQEVVEITQNSRQNEEIQGVIQHFASRLDRMEMKLFNYEVELTKSSDSNRHLKDALRDIIEMIKERDRKLDLVSKGCSGIGELYQELDQKLENCSKLIQSVQAKQDKNTSNDHILKELSRRIDEAEMRSKLAVNADKIFEEEIVLNILNKPDNSQRLQKTIKGLGFLYSIEDSLYVKELGLKIEQLKEYLDNEIEGISQVVDELGEEIVEGSNRKNYVSFSKFALKGDLDALKTELTHRLLHDTTTRKEDLSFPQDSPAPINENQIKDLKDFLVEQLDTKLDKREADLFQNEFERIVKQIEELTRKIDDHGKSLNGMDSLYYKTKDKVRKSQRKAYQSSFTYNLSPDEHNSKEFTEDKLIPPLKIADFSKQNNPTSISVQSDRETRMNGSNIPEITRVKSSRENNFNSFEKSLLLGNPDHVVGKQNKLFKKGVEEVRLSFVLSGKKADDQSNLYLEEAEDEDDNSEKISRRLFHGKDAESSVEDNSGRPYKTQTFLSTLQNITNYQQQQLETPIEEEELSPEPKSHAMPPDYDKENWASKVNMNSSGRKKPFKLIEPDSRFNFEKWAKENSIQLSSFNLSEMGDTINHQN